MTRTPRIARAATLGLAIALGGNASGATPHPHDASRSPAIDAESTERGGKPDAPLSSLQRSGPRHLPYFTLYDAHADLLLDEDGDGFHQRLRVNFDADVDHDQYEDVYAELFLSRDGGPWVRYHTTDVFTIWGDAADDDYAVTSTLLEGYPSGYYDIAIDLYALGHGFVTSIDSNHSTGLRALPLEDADRDLRPSHPPPPSGGVVDSHEGGGAGAFGGWLVWLTGFAAWTRRRADRAASG